jgi:hypothetical protein
LRLIFTVKISEGQRKGGSEMEQSEGRELVPTNGNIVIPTVNARVFVKIIGLGGSPTTVSP